MANKRPVPPSDAPANKKPAKEAETPATPAVEKPSAPKTTVDIAALVQKVQARVPHVPREEIEPRISKLVLEFQVPPEEAVRSVLNLYGSRGSARLAPAADARAADLTEAGKWVNIKAKVLQLWEPRTPSIAQTGLLGDESGTVKFVSWAKAGLPKVEEGKSYQFRNAVTDSYQGRVSIKMNRTSAIVPLAEEVRVAPRERRDSVVQFEGIKEADRWVTVRGRILQLWQSRSEAIAQAGLVGDETGQMKFTIFAGHGHPEVEEGKSYEFRSVVTDKFNDRLSVKVGKTSAIIPLEQEVVARGTPVEMVGALLDVLPGSGYIKRCPQCGRMVQKGACSEHGSVSPVEDIRVKAILDDGAAAKDILLNRELAERCTGITLDQARKRVEETLDTAAILDDIKRTLFGRYFHVRGPQVGRYILVETLEELGPPDLGEGL